MKTNKIILLASIIIIAVLTTLAFISTTLNDLTTITTTDIYISNAVEQAIQFNTIKVLLLLFLLGYVIIEIYGYFEHLKKLKSTKDNFKEFEEYLKSIKSKVEEFDRMFNSNGTRGVPVTPSEAFKDIVFDKKQPEPQRTDYVLGVKGDIDYDRALENYKNNEKS